MGTKQQDVVERVAQALEVEYNAQTTGKSKIFPVPHISHRALAEAAIAVMPNDDLKQAAMNLYVAGRWDCPNVANAAELWEALRDALGLPKGTATNAGVAEKTDGKL